MAESRQSTFSPAGECTKLACKAFTFCSLEKLYGENSNKQLKYPTRLNKHQSQSQQERRIDTCYKGMEDQMKAQVK